jgi:hypothetical protein
MTRSLRSDEMHHHSLHSTDISGHHDAVWVLMASSAWFTSGKAAFALRYGFTFTFVQVHGHESLECAAVGLLVQQIWPSVEALRTVSACRWASQSRCTCTPLNLPGQWDKSAGDRVPGVTTWAMRVSTQFPTDGYKLLPFSCTICCAGRSNTSQERSGCFLSST